MNNNNIFLRKVDYNINFNEIILIQSLLNQEYFENIEIMNVNNFIEQNNVYDNVNPINDKQIEKTLTFKIKNNKNVTSKTAKKNFALPHNRTFLDF